jgi:hypothetical protein
MLKDFNTEALKQIANAADKRAEIMQGLGDMEDDNVRLDMTTFRLLAGAIDSLLGK